LLIAFGRRLAASLALAAALSSTAGDADAQIVQVAVSTSKAVCENGYCRRVASNCTGSGTLVASGDTYHPGKSLVLSCSHILDGESPRVTVHGHPARVIGQEQTAESDLSLIEVDHDFGQVLPLADDDDEITGQKAWAVGWGEANNSQTGIVQTSRTMSAQIQPGYSGGPVLYRGRVRGVLWGRAVEGKPVCYFTPCVTIRRFVEKFRCGRYVYRERSRVVLAEVAPPPPIDEQPPRPVEQPPRQITPTPTQLQPIAPTDAQVRAAVEAWLTAHADELRGPQGERGPSGQTGIGAPGLAATDSQIQKSVETWIMANRKKLLIDVSIAWKDGTPVATFNDVPAGAKINVKLDKQITDAK